MGGIPRKEGAALGGATTVGSVTSPLEQETMQGHDGETHRHLIPAMGIAE